MAQPLLTCYFQKRDDGKDSWIQFKFERLLDFCYKCGALDHVTGRCNFNTPATVTSVNGVVANMFRPWLRAEHQGSLSFFNLHLEVENEVMIAKEIIARERFGLESNPCRLNELLEAQLSKIDPTISISEEQARKKESEIVQNEVA